MQNFDKTQKFQMTHNQVNIWITPRKSDQKANKVHGSPYYSPINSITQYIKTNSQINNSFKWSDQESFETDSITISVTHIESNDPDILELERLCSQPDHYD